MKNRQHFTKTREDLENEIFLVPNFNDLKPKFFKLGIDFSDGISYYYENDNDPENTDYSNYQSSMYMRILGICSHIRDLDIFWQWKTLIRFCKYQGAPFLNQELSFRGEHYFFRVYANFNMKSNCQKYYFSRTCWKKCEDVSPRFHCDAEGNEVCDNYYEDIVFHYKYNITEDIYLSFSKVDEFVSHCIFYNNCAFKMTFDKICTIGLCYPLWNHTHTCLVFNPVYIMSKYSDTLNATFNSVVSGEYIFADIGLLGNQYPIVKNHSLCFWTVPVWNDNFLEIDMTTNISILQPTDRIKFGLYHFLLACHIGRFRAFNFHRYFIIHALPLKFEIFNITFGKSKIYIGQTLQCISDGVPQNISEHILSILSQNFDNNKNKISISTIYVPYYASTGYCTMECAFVFNFRDERPKYSVSHLFNLIIKSYVFFEWKRKTKNVYSTSDRAGCIYLAYFHGIITINVISKMGELDTYPTDNFSTFTNQGGIFKLICVLKPALYSTIVFFKITMFEIFKMPSRVCIPPFIAVPGSLIRCGHDGYPQDQTKYRLSIKVDKQDVKSSNTHYIQIPYIISSADLKFFCQIKFTLFDKITISYISMGVSLSPVGNKVVEFTEDDRICSMNFEEPIENAQQISASEILFNADSCLLTEVYESILEIWFGVFILFIVFTVFGVVVIRRKIQDIQFVIRRTEIKRRQVNDKLIDLAQIAIVGKVGKMGVFKFKFTGHIVHLSELKN